MPPATEASSPVDQDEYSFERLTVYTLPGVNADVDLHPFAFPSDNAHVRFVRSLDDEILHANREQALRLGMMTGVTYDDPEFSEKLREVADSRPKASTYAIATFGGPAHLDLSKAHRDFGDIVVGFDLVTRGLHRAKTADSAAAVASALALVAHPGQVRKVVDCIYFFDRLGRPHYVSHPLLGEITLSASWDAPQLDKFKALCIAGFQNRSVQRPVRLLASTLNPDMDDFQRMLTTWTALEVLTNKLYGLFRQEFVSGKPRPTLAHDVEIAVDADSAKLAAKFALVAAYLRPTETAVDHAAFVKAKRWRDLLLHTGEPPDGDHLRTATALVVAYLTQYLSRPTNESPGSQSP